MLAVLVGTGFRAWRRRDLWLFAEFFRKIFLQELARVRCDHVLQVELLHLLLISLGELLIRVDLMERVPGVNQQKFNVQLVGHLAPRWTKNGLQAFYRP